MELPIWLGLSLTLVAGFVLCSVAWVGASRLVRSPGETGVRATATFIVAAWLHGILFYVLTFSGLFYWWTTLLSVVALGGAAALVVWRSSSVRALLVRDLTEARRAISVMFSGSPRVLSIAVVVVIGMQLVRALLAPPLAWDSLTYHLVRAALWVQTGELWATTGAPGAWEYFRAFLPLGDSVSAWSMVFSHSDALIPLAWVSVWAAGVLASTQAARELGARGDVAYVTAVVGWTIPALGKHAFVAHIDNLWLALALAAFALFAYARRAERPAATGLALAALGICIAIKMTAAPFVFAGILAWAVLLYLHRGQRLRAFMSPVGALLVSVPAFVYQWLTYGSPTYPFPLEIGGKKIFAGSPEWQFVMDHETSKTAWDYLEKLFLQGPYGGYVTHINFGPVLPAVLVIGLIALVRLLYLRSNAWWLLLLYLAASGLGIYLLLESYTWTGNTIARHIAIAPLVLVACAGTFRSGAVRDVLIVAALGQMVFMLPFNWSVMDLHAMRDFLLDVWPFLAVACAALWWSRGRALRRWAVATGLVVVVLSASFVTMLKPVRDNYRHNIYRQLELRESYGNIQVGGVHGVGFKNSRVWRRVDRPGEPYRIAVTGGWDGRGINWAVYPLFGRRLQNTVMYVPVTEDGTVVPIRPRREFRKKADYDAWVDRLREREIDMVATIGPHSLEARWVRTHKKDFEKLVKGGHRDNLLYRVLE